MEEYSQLLSRLYKIPVTSIRNITFQVTDDCTLCCSYCYQINKNTNYMTKDTAKKIVDLLFKMYDEDDKTALINKDTKAIILDFIGGEPLLNIDVISFICEYFLNKCIKLNHPWTHFWRASMISNGDLYFTPKVQDFLKKFGGFCSLGITLDGPQEVHDKCRFNKKGEGNFHNAFAALQDLKEKYNYIPPTKITISPENLDGINQIFDFFIKQGTTDINMNPINEHQWTEEEASRYYFILKEIADKLLLNSEISVSIFNDNAYCPIPETDLAVYCGGLGEMLAFSPEGIAYPCIRYMESSLGEVPPIIIGNTEGIYQTQSSKKILQTFKTINRKTQNTKKCFYCPIAAGCSECAAWSYQQAGCLGKRSTNICLMHYAQALANCYYWNQLYRKNKENKRFKLYLPKNESLKIISLKEYYYLLTLSEY